MHELPRQAEVAVVGSLVDQLRRDRLRRDPSVAELALPVRTSRVVAAGERRGRLQPEGVRGQLGRRPTSVSAGVAELVRLAALPMLLLATRNTAP